MRIKSILLSFLLLSLIYLSFYVMGCGSGAVVSGGGGGSSGWIASRSPSLGASITSKNINATITFNRDMNTAESGDVITSESHTAGEPVGINTFWSDKRTFNAYITGPMSGGAGTLVNILAAYQGFRDAAGSYLPENTELWRATYDYNTLESYSITGEVSQPSGTTKGIVYIIVYDHLPTSYNDFGFIAMTTIEASGTGPWPYSLHDLGNGSSYYVNAFRNVWDTPKWYHGYACDQNGAINLNSDKTGINLALNANAFNLESQSPALDATGVSKSRQISLTFNNAIDISTFSEEAFFFADDHTAGAPIIIGEPFVSEDMRTFYATIENWAGGTGNFVHMTSTNAARVLDANNSYIADNTDLWRCYLNTYSISGTLTGGSATMEVYSDEEVYVYLSTEPTLSSFVGSDEVELDETADYILGNLENDTYYVVATTNDDGPPIRNDLVGWYNSSWPYTSPSGVSVSGSNRTGIDFPLFCYTALESYSHPFGKIRGYVSSSISTVEILVAVSNSPTYETFVANYFLPASASAGNIYYRFNGLSNGTYYLAVIQNLTTPEAFEPPKSGDMVGTAEVTINNNNATISTITLQQQP